jgi:hypothetical protein
VGLHHATAVKLLLPLLRSFATHTLFAARKS